MKLQDYLKRFALVPAILSIAAFSSISFASIYTPGHETIAAPADVRIYVAHHFGNRPDGLEDPENVHGGDTTQRPNEMTDPNGEDTPPDPAGRPDENPGQPDDSRQNQDRNPEN